MGHIHKAAAAALALAITLAGATLAAAPMVLADFQSVAAPARDGSAGQLREMAADPQPAASSARAG